MTLADTLDRLSHHGFTLHFGVVNDGLRAFDSGETFAPHEVVIREYQRFEGVSNPDDMAIVYAIESRTGRRGYLVDAFGVYADPAVGVFLQDVPIRRDEEWKARTDRPIPTPLLHVRLAEQLERLEQEPTWRASGHDAITLTKEPSLRLVLMRLGKGSKLAEHKAPGPIVLHVLSGSVSLRSGSRAELVGPGELVVLEAAIGHEVEAVEDSACLLTLTGSFHPGERPTA